jgi:Transposase IS116/IS110/IS902 family
VQEPESRRPDGSAIAEVDTSSTPPTSPLQRAVELLNTIPGVDQLTAWTLVAEMGVNMNQFGSASQLAKWAGLCPGNNESAGKRLSSSKASPRVLLEKCTALTLQSSLVGDHLLSMQIDFPDTTRLPRKTLRGLILLRFICEACQRSYAVCILSQRSGCFCPKASLKRTDMSGEIPARLLNMRVTVERATPIYSANSPMVIGSSLSASLSTVPGCGGLCMAATENPPSMIVLIIDQDGVPFLEQEGEPPVAAYLHCPMPFQLACERM